MRIFSPFQNVTALGRIVISLAIWTTVLLAWQFLHNPLVPTPGMVLEKVFSIWVGNEPILGGRPFSQDLTISLFLTLQGMVYSITIALLIAYLSVIPAFKPIGEFAVRFRYMAMTGLIFLFMLLTKDGSQLKTALLVIGIVPFFVTSLLATIEDIPTEEYDLCRTLRMGDWQVLYETIIRGRMSAALDAIIVNFAVAWMMITSVESLSQSEGGLGTLILKFNKAHDIAAVFAVMINIFVLGLAVDKFLKYAKGVFFPHTKFK